ncbi:restriction endonuclease [Amnibacterium kyonggiense]|uniref:restriction endonuclease n=1 Tax=Amnibacterium kyonggiense TaxID=595671 RepID=UPI0013C354AA|nr:restriction endonuclease [Amnibacterium kyonggiense]
MARRHASDQTTPAAGAGAVVLLMIVLIGMVIFANVSTPTLMPVGWPAAICVIFGGIAVAAMIAGVVGTRAEKVRYTQVGGPVLSWQAAEQMAANHMRAYGFSDARTTPAGADSGIDVVSRWGVAQVKYFSKPVGRPEVQKLRGAAHGRDRVLFYALTGFNTNAVQFANECGIALFQFDQRGMVWPVNPLAKAYKKPEPTTA